MRSVRRLGLTPPTLQPGGAGGKKKAEHFEQWKGGAKEFDFPGHWRAADVRGALIAEHGFACAYCNREFDEDRLDAVDHFRPKKAPEEDPEHGGYWWLAYEMGNYLHVCSRCNSSFKRSQFPIHAGSSHARYDEGEAWRREKRLLLDPATDPVESWIQMSMPDCVLGPADDLSRRQKAMVEKTIELLGLNLGPMVRHRVQALRNVIRWEASGLRDQAAAAASRVRPDSVAAYHFLASKRKDWLPSEENELMGLVKDVHHKLCYASEHGPLEVAERLLYALGALYAAAATGPRDYLAARPNLLREVKQKADQFAP